MSFSHSPFLSPFLPLCTASLFYIRSPSFQRSAECGRSVPLKAMLPPQHATARSSSPVPPSLHIDYSHLGISTWSRAFSVNALLLCTLLPSLSRIQHSEVELMDSVCLKVKREEVMNKYLFGIFCLCANSLWKCY